MKEKNSDLKNIIGPQIRRIRLKMGLTQEQLAAKCQLAGFDVSRGVLSQIEAQLRCVSDYELLKLSRILKVSAQELLSHKMKE
jgi:transcriptional regulator with XRE-family HTH domain